MKSILSKYSMKKAISFFKSYSEYSVSLKLISISLIKFPRDFLYFMKMRYKFSWFIMPNKIHRPKMILIFIMNLWIYLYSILDILFLKQ